MCYDPTTVRYEADDEDDDFDSDETSTATATMSDDGAPWASLRKKTATKLAAGTWYARGAAEVRVSEVENRSAKLNIRDMYFNKRALMELSEFAKELAGQLAS